MFILGVGTRYLSPCLSSTAFLLSKSNPQSPRYENKYDRVQLMYPSVLNSDLRLSVFDKLRTRLSVLTIVTIIKYNGSPY